MFRFTIRDLLWLTLVVALGLAWFIREAQHRSRYELRLEAHNARREADEAKGAAETAQQVAKGWMHHFENERSARRYLAARLLEALERLGEFDPKVNPTPDWAN
jgi:hypothetical protein